MASDSSDKLVKETNLNMLRATLGFGLAWFAWRLTSPDFWMLGYVALVCAVAGAWRGLLGLIGLGRIGFDIGWGRLKRFRRRGTKAKADKLPNEKDLRDRGLIK